ncbi:MAG: hypothetical protein HHJ12_03305 [Glaciimonas sp.]|nr:hypothetical protein [Glaciimonas sp.]
MRNRLDGSVEASVAGETQALTHIIAWAKHGPAGAQVQPSRAGATRAVEPR